MTYYESQFAVLGKINEYGVTFKFIAGECETKHLTISAEDFEKVKELLLTIEKAKQ